MREIIRSAATDRGIRRRYERKNLLGGIGGHKSSFAVFPLFSESSAKFSTIDETPIPLSAKSSKRSLVASSIMGEVKSAPRYEET